MVNEQLNALSVYAKQNGYSAAISEKYQQIASFASNSTNFYSANRAVEQGKALKEQYNIPAEVSLGAGNLKDLIAKYNPPKPVEMGIGSGVVDAFKNGWNWFSKSVVSFGNPTGIKQTYVDDNPNISSRVYKEEYEKIYEQKTFWEKTKGFFGGVFETGKIWFNKEMDYNKEQLDRLKQGDFSGYLSNNLTHHLTNLANEVKVVKDNIASIAIAGGIGLGLGYGLGALAITVPPVALAVGIGLATMGVAALASSYSYDLNKLNDAAKGYYTLEKSADIYQRLSNQAIADKWELSAGATGAMVGFPYGSSLMQQKMAQSGRNIFGLEFDKVEKWTMAEWQTKMGRTNPPAGATMWDPKITGDPTGKSNVLVETIDHQTHIDYGSVVRIHEYGELAWRKGIIKTSPFIDSNPIYHDVAIDMKFTSKFTGKQVLIDAGHGWWGYLKMPGDRFYMKGGYPIKVRLDETTILRIIQDTKVNPVYNPEINGAVCSGMLIDNETITAPWIVAPELYQKFTKETIKYKRKGSEKWLVKTIKSWGEYDELVKDPNVIYIAPIKIKFSKGKVRHKMIDSNNWIVKELKTFEEFKKLTANPRIKCIDIMYKGNWQCQEK